MKKTRFQSLLALAFIALLLSSLAACGGEQPTAEVVLGDTPVQEDTSPPEDTAAPENTVARQPTAPGQAPAEGQFVVDNAGPSFSIEEGDWGSCSEGECSGTPYGPDFRYAEIGCTGCRARFEFRVPADGEYAVWTWWPWGEDRATDTPYILKGGGDAITIQVDQRNSGDDWFSLGDYHFNAGIVTVIVQGSESGYANADAVALTPAGSGPPSVGPIAQLTTTVPAEEPTAQPEATSQPEGPTVPPATPFSPPPSGGAIVVDYTCTDLSRIPDRWLQAAKQMTVQLAHRSHGSQIVTGLEWLQDQDSRYAVTVRNCAGDVGLEGGPGVLRICDGNPPVDYVEAEQYWSSDDGLAGTRAAVGTGLFNVSNWTWCGELSGYDSATVQQYLDTLNQLGAQFPNTVFIYWTDHTDGGSDLLAQNNELIRRYVQANDKVLFDFASFESYDPSGTYHPDVGDACEWCDSWCNSHPDDCRNLDQMGDCAHTHPLQCKLKAQAFWWLMARLAGWDGQ